MEPDDLQRELSETLAALTGQTELDQLALLLRRACHDLNNALGTMSLEHYSVGAILDEVAVTVPADELVELRAALANADGARGSCEKLVEAIHRSVKELDA